MVKETKPGKDKPIVLVAYVSPTAGQMSSISELLGAAKVIDPADITGPARECKEAAGIDSGRRYVYGLKGISNLFGVSKVTAQKYKDGILKDAVYQSGRKIVVDADKAMALFIESGRAAL